MVIKFKLLQFKKVFDIFQVTRNQVVHPDYIIPFTDKPVAQMRTQESCCTGY